MNPIPDAPDVVVAFMLDAADDVIEKGLRERQARGKANAQELQRHIRRNGGDLHAGLRSYGAANGNSKGGLSAAQLRQRREAARSRRSGRRSDLASFEKDSLSNAERRQRINAARSKRRGRYASDREEWKVSRATGTMSAGARRHRRRRAARGRNIGTALLISGLAVSARRSRSERAPAAIRQPERAQGSREFDAQKAEFDARSAEFDARSAEFDLEQRKIANRKKGLDARERELREAATRVSQREEMMDRLARQSAMASGILGALDGSAGGHQANERKPKLGPYKSTNRDIQRWN